MESFKERKKRRTAEEENRWQERRARRSERMAKLWEQGFDAFTILGESKKQTDFVDHQADINYIISRVLEADGINEQTINEKVFAKILGLPAGNFDEFVGLLINAIYDGRLPKNEQAKSLVQDYVNKISDFSAQTKSGERKLGLRDIIGITQHKRAMQRQLHEEELLTEEQIKQRGFRLSDNAAALYSNRPGAKDRYDWASIRLNRHSNVLEMPIKDFITGKEVLTKEEHDAKGLTLFNDYLINQGYQLGQATHAYSEEENVVVSGKKIYLSNKNLSRTENAILTMYEINKQNLKQKGLFGGDKTLKDAMEFFSKETIKIDDKRYNPRKYFKKNKFVFQALLDNMQDAIATLATINMARIYFEPKTFEKIEDYLELQAARQLGNIPKEHSVWLMPYISNKVLQLSANNFVDNNISSLSQLKAIYKNTGRLVDGAKTIEDLIFSKRDYSSILKKQKSNKKDAKKQNKESTADQTTDQESTEQSQAENVASEEEISAAKHMIKGFLLNNIAQHNTKRYAKFMAQNAVYVERLHKDGVDMTEVSQVLYEKIATHLDENPSVYQKENSAGFVSTGAVLVKRFLEAQKAGESAEKYMKTIIEQAVEEVKNNTKKQEENKEENKEEAENTASGS